MDLIPIINSVYWWDVHAPSISLHIQFPNGRCPEKHIGAAHHRSNAARGITGEVKILSESARSAAEAATALGVEVGQIASSIVFKLPDGRPLLVISSGAHRVDTELVAQTLGVEKLHRADADFVKSASGISIGGVAPIGWLSPATILIDEALNDYEIVWAAAGHPHVVFPTTFVELKKISNAKPMIVGE